MSGSKDNIDGFLPQNKLPAKVCELIDAKGNKQQSMSGSLDNIDGFLPQNILPAKVCALIDAQVNNEGNNFATLPQAGRGKKVE